eukprot:TRINITY_DN8752_c0_g1_i1.p1 TRINITY_DN8752_c0_g1~~TRINITY_DN8752_c0_g1_i1.p1  ORF type:complete len:115 (-),score=19.36 TRINITY_DN8752_c0_g1_i1:47-391(-)
MVDSSSSSSSTTTSTQGAKATARTAQDLERVSDSFKEEKEINVKVNVDNEIGIIHQSSAESKRQSELAAIKVKAEDIELLVQELEITPERADRSIRENKGNVVDALRSLINSPA